MAGKAAAGEALRAKKAGHQGVKEEDHAGALQGADTGHPLEEKQVLVLLELTFRYITFKSFGCPGQVVRVWTVGRAGAPSRSASRRWAHKACSLCLVGTACCDILCATTPFDHHALFEHQCVQGILARQFSVTFSVILGPPSLQHLVRADGATGAVHCLHTLGSCH